jgi:hypothetical protein
MWKKKRHDWQRHRGLYYVYSKWEASEGKNILKNNSQKQHEKNETPKRQSELYITHHKKYNVLL